LEFLFQVFPLLSNQPKFSNQLPAPEQISIEAHTMTESIYKFVEEPKPPKPKKEIYKSKYDPKGPLIGSTFCMQGTTVVDGKGFHSLKKVGTRSLTLGLHFSSFRSHT